jgi:CBS domain containing-hemolysin-like protein
MGGFSKNIALLIFFILLNGVFAISEIAIASACKGRAITEVPPQPDVSGAGT